MAGLGSLFIDLLARTGKFETDIGRAARVAEKRAKEIDRAFNRLGSNISSALGGIAAGFSLKAVIDATVEAENAMAALEVAVKNNAGAAGLTTSELSDMASELQKLSTFDDEAIMGMQALLLTFKEISGTELKRAQSAILDLSTALGQDLNSAAMLVGRALADPVAGMKRLSRAGVVLTDDQKKLIKQLAETGQMSKAQGALLEQLEARFGGAAEAARNTFGGALQGVKNAVGDLLEQKSGLPKAIEELNNLEKSLQNPGLKTGLDGLSGALLSVAGVAVKAMSAAGDFVQAFSNVGSLIDKQLFGDELPVDLKVRLQEPSDAEIDELEASLARAMRLRSNKKLVFFGKDGIVKWYSDEELDEEIARLTKKIDAANNKKEAPSGGGPAAPTPPSEEFVKLSERLEEQIALYGKTGEAAKISYQIQKGALDEMSKSEQQQLLALARRYDAVVKSAEAEKKATEQQKQAQQEWQEVLERGARIAEEVRTPLERYRDALQDLNDALALGVISQETYRRSLIRIQDELVPTAEAISDFASQNSDSLSQGLESFEADFESRFIKGMDTLTVFQEQAARNMQDIIADSLVNGFDDGAKGILKSFGQMIVKLTAQAVAADIAKRLFGAAAGGTGGGWISAAAGALGFGGGRAIGGPVLAGTTYRINEREPEFFRPRVGGDIIPLSKMPSGGGMVLHQNFSVRTESGERVSRRTEQQIAAAASRGMAMASRRNN